MDNFNLYAKYYDLLNSDKDYQSEVDYIVELINKASNQEINTLLDLGCGTGIHANLLTEKGFNVDGVDMSIQMVEQAKLKFENNPALQFFEGDITKFENGKTYDVVTSLFHVMSYQNSNEAVKSAMMTAHKHLNENGLFVFDFWYGPGVLTDRPTNRVKQLENDDIRVERKATPELLINENVVHVNYEINIVDKVTSREQNIKERHSMRYFFIPELSYFLKTAGFTVDSYYEWKRHDRPNTDSWNVVIVAKKQSV